MGDNGMLVAIAYDSAEYERMLDLRRRVLREPLGLDFTPSQRQSEAGHFHLAWYDSKKLVACLVLQPLDSEKIRMRQVAVEPSWQRRGVGRAMVAACERFARERGFATIVANARETATGFYERLGYRTTDERFIEVGIPHVRVEKRLI